MNQTLSILLVEDDPKACKEICNYINTLDNVQLNGITNDSTQAISLVQDTLPEAVILELELHHGSGNGFLFLSALKQLKLAKSPYILITTNNSSDITYEYARCLGADFIMSKHQSGYSPRQAVEFLQMIHENIFWRTSVDSVSIQLQESPEPNEKEMIIKIQRELNSVGISTKVLGYQYLTDAILSAIDNPENNLVSFLSKKYSKSDTSIERAMQNAISRAWRTSDVNYQLTKYTAKISSEKGVPTLMEFVSYYVNKLRVEK